MSHHFKVLATRVLHNKLLRLNFSRANSGVALSCVIRHRLNVTTRQRPRQSSKAPPPLGRESYFHNFQKFRDLEIYSGEELGPIKSLRTESAPLQETALETAAAQNLVLEILETYPGVLDDQTLETRDTALTIKLLCNSYRSLRTRDFGKQVAAHMSNLLEHYINGNLPPHQKQVVTYSTSFGMLAKNISLLNSSVSCQNKIHAFGNWRLSA
jgi:hypothetical protein